MVKEYTPYQLVPHSANTDGSAQRTIRRDESRAVAQHPFRKTRDNVQVDGPDLRVNSTKIVEDEPVAEAAPKADAVLSATTSVSSSETEPETLPPAPLIHPSQMMLPIFQSDAKVASASAEKDSL